AVAEKSEDSPCSAGYFTAEIRKGDTVWTSFANPGLFRKIFVSSPLEPVLSIKGLTLRKSGESGVTSVPLFHEINFGKGKVFVFSNPIMFSSGRIFKNIPELCWAFDAIETDGKIVLGFVAGFISLFLMTLCSVFFKSKASATTAFILIFYVKIFSLFSTLSLSGSELTVSVLALNEKVRTEVSSEISKSGAVILYECEDLLMFSAKRHFVSSQYGEGVFLSVASFGDNYVYDEKNIPDKSAFARILRFCQR
ncbi:hypothetical protein JXL83_06375, partial [candidate division WOR-3 bacterium]|nr:hypothetical protein [candidate division WOR-3 bacterium]